MRYNQICNDISVKIWIYLVKKIDYLGLALSSYINICNHHYISIRVNINYSHLKLSSLLTVGTVEPIPFFWPRDKHIRKVASCWLLESINNVYACTLIYAFANNLIGKFMIQNKFCKHVNKVHITKSQVLKWP